MKRCWSGLRVTGLSAPDLAEPWLSPDSARGRIAEKLVAREPKNADYSAVLGFALYRKGDLQTRPEAGSEPPLRFRSHELQASKLVLAMAYHRLGRGEDAQSLFAK